MTALLDLLEEHPDAARYDLLTHGYRPEWLGTARLPWIDARVILQQQRPERSAVWRATHPDEYDRTAEVVRLEAVAVLVAQLRSLWNGDRKMPTTFEDLLPPKPAQRVVLSEEEVLAAMRAFDRAIGRG